MSCSTSRTARPSETSTRSSAAIDSVSSSLRPVTRPTSTSMLISDSARRPPKRTTTSSADRSAIGHLLGRRNDAGPLEHLVRHVQRTIELGDLLDGERPLQPEIVDLVARDVLLAKFGDRQRFLL